MVEEYIYFANLPSLPAIAGKTTSRPLLIGSR